MKRGKTRILWIILILFIILWVPYFENISSTGVIKFFGTAWTFVGLYPILLFIGVIQGFLIAIYVKSLIIALSNEDVEKFDL